MSSEVLGTYKFLSIFAGQCNESACSLLISSLPAEFHKISNFQKLFNHSSRLSPLFLYVYHLSHSKIKKKIYCNYNRILGRSGLNVYFILPCLTGLTLAWLKEIKNMCKALQLSMWHGGNFNSLGRKEKEDKGNQDWDRAWCLVREWWVMEWWVGHRRCCCEIEVRGQLHVVSLDSDSAWLLPSSFHLFLCPSFLSLPHPSLRECVWRDSHVLGLRLTHSGS